MLLLPAYLEKKMDLPVAIFGSGISGLAVAKLLKKLNWEYNFYDRDGKDFTEKDAEKSSIVITSPGFSLEHNWIKIAEDKKLFIYGEMDFASIFCENPIVAITGTNGKTTLVTLLNHLWNKLIPEMVQKCYQGSLSIGTRNRNDWIFTKYRCKIHFPINEQLFIFCNFYPIMFQRKTRTCDYDG